MEGTARRNLRNLQPGLVVLFFFLPLLLQGQNAYQVTPSEIFYWKDQTFTLSINTDLREGTAIEVLEANWPEQIRLVDGPKVRPFEWEQDGQFIQGTKISFAFRVVDAGLTQAGPIRIGHPGGVMVISPFPMVFVLWDERNNNYPMEVEWDISPGPYYQFSPILAQLLIKNLETVEIPFGNDLSSPAGAILESAPELGVVRSFHYFDRELHEIPWGTWLLTPSRAGELSLPRPDVSFKGIRRLPPRVRLEVLPLPEEVQETQAVGNFDYSVGVDRSSLSLQDSLEVTQTLTGVGNFPYLQLPEMSFDGFEILQTLEESNFQPVLEGYRGSKSRTYVLLPLEAGDRTLFFDRFYWFDNLTREVRSISPNGTIVRIARSDEVATKEERLGFLPWNEVWSAGSLKLFRNPFSYLALLPGLVFFFVYALRKRRKTKGVVYLSLFLGVSLMMSMALFVPPEPQAQKSAREFFINQDYASALGEMATLSEEYPELGGVDFNIALTYYKLGQADDTVSSLIRAWRKGMRSERIASFFALIQEENNLAATIDPFFGFSEDLAFFIFALFFNLAFVTWTLMIRNNQVTLIFLLVSAFIISAGGLATGLVSAAGEGNVIGVLQERVNILRAPLPVATPWIAMKRGTVLDILGFHQGYFQVRNGNGIKGWVKEESLESFLPEDYLSR
jgi:hypothetical protein